MVIKRCHCLFVIMSLLGLFSCAQSTTQKSEKTRESEQRRIAKLLPDDAAMGTPDYHRAALINVELGLGYLSQGQVARAKTKLTHAVQLAPKIPETHSAMAYFLEMIGEFKDAEREHKKAVGFSGQGAVYNNYGAFLCRRGRLKEADQAFHAAIEDKEYPRTAEVYENAGLCALKWPDDRKATEYLTIAVRRDPSRSSAFLELAALSLKQEKFEEAKEWLNRYRAIADQTARSLWLGIGVSKGLKDENSAESQAATLKNLFENSPEYQLYLKSGKS
ncbi:MAG TPA: type IV pilus biogenesis/stability protein PilW [Gammaproteobacteria bacterium]|nr:type IV pilus biogenesis/stability protein PilW [Gammaproteobacteria bacterium]HQY23023.1 type IV pilus biogenesis/stability protein PilW [Gammaproteobacteria bacterium]HQZ88227.1 type IV pilus biogenesis/stability protein PilW [Gammaproteobacteria bacterium]HRA42419.1 type IV pilus biogenesis/stability protein PilW [Gammaproteobacteria bacterium]